MLKYTYLITDIIRSTISNIDRVFIKYVLSMKGEEYYDKEEWRTDGRNCSW